MSPAGRRQRLPRVEVETRRWAPGWVVRVLAAVTPAALVLIALSRSRLPEALDAVAVGVAALLVGWSLWRPGHRPALTGVGLTAFLVLTAASGPDPAALGLAPLGYIAVRLAAWAGAVGWTTRVELAVLGRSALRDGAVVGVTLLVGALAFGVRGASAPTLVLGAAALLALAWWLLRPEDDS
ncbi:hypothetical protein [Xylanimonas ulmi]|uniref:Uncharacterized protein n=1 Tax=Xylanimonas ulmi TaxID=228973 RepID=A0A4Q7M4D8_9MICO|nr:hypothetical protein [Xylanibacterium ulmi]RZS60849.1 hypothetical protein EV386_1129 [Xylanibacterium ulmi]